MHPDGVCRLPGGLYTKTVEYEDINYSVASTEDQTAIFGGWSSFLNYFDSSLPFQLSFINRRSHSRSRYRVNIPQGDDDFNSIREEYTGMLKNQIAKSNNGIERSKYITFGIPAEGIAEARPRLERVEADVMGNFKRLGVPSEPMDGRARLALLHSQMHPGNREPFRFSWKDIPQTGLGTKDFTQRPVDIGTYPKPPHNAPDEIVNYDQRIPVEGGAFLAWGHLTYTKPLTERQTVDYELRPAPGNPDRPRPIAQQMKEAAKLAGADRGDPVHKKKAPAREER